MSPLKSCALVPTTGDEHCAMEGELGMMGLLSLLVLGSTALVAVDATRRDWAADGFADAAWKWIVGMLLVWFVALPLYLLHRRRAPLLGDVAAAVATASAAFDAPERPGSVPPPGMG
jgi:hypothetical protein